MATIRAAGGRAVRPSDFLAKTASCGQSTLSFSAASSTSIRRRAVPCGHAGHSLRTGRHVKPFVLRGGVNRRSQSGMTGSGPICRSAETSEASTATTAESSSATESEAFPYNWFKQWYPLAPLSVLDPSRPNPTELLGQRLVLWRDAAGEWQCFKDRCPHRLAPLSEGRIENGRMMCSYHGWEFEGDGSCSRIPQADSPKAEAAAMAANKSCVERHPTQVRHGLLFVWGEAGSIAQIEASGSPVPVVPELDDPETAPKYNFVSNWFTCLLPYGFDTLIENVIDPSHVPFSHHGKQGNRKDGKAIPMALDGDVSLEKGFLVKTFSVEEAAKGEAVMKGESNRTLSFVPPSMLHYRFGSTPEGLVRFNLMTYAVPVKPGICRIVFSTFTAMNSPIFKLLSMKPTWLDHIGRMEVLAGDGVFLHAQERELRRRGSADDFDKKYFMPMSCDAGVLAFRKWYHRMAGGSVTYAEGTDLELPPLETDRRVLLDRWSTHVKDCPSCSGAHRSLGIAKVAALAVAAVLFLALAASLGQGPGTKSVAILMGRVTVLQSTLTNAMLGAATLVCLFVAKKSMEFQQKLVFEDYVHSEMD